MTNKIYRTAQGKTIDLGALMLQNENERAVGNMKVNARGDKIDANGELLASRSQQTTKQYRQQTNTSSAPVPSSNRAIKEAEAEAQRAEEERRIAEARAARQAKREAVSKGEPGTESTATNESLTGLAAAMAAAKSQPDEE